MATNYSKRVKKLLLTKTDLPFTGGVGTTLLIVIAIGAITIGTAAVVIDKKRQAN